MARVSKKKQAEIREKLIEVAADLMVRQGYDKTSMREIARAADVGDATIYNYFPHKEALIWGYVQLRHEKAISEIEAIPDWDSYTLQEQLQCYYETILAQFLPEREWMPEIIRLTHHSVLAYPEALETLTTVITDQIRSILEAAIERKEIPDQPIGTLLPKLGMDMYLAVAGYWMKDKSEHFANTTQFIDHLLGIFVSVLKEGLISKGIGLVSFFFRNHLMQHLGSGKSHWEAMKSDLKGFGL